MRRIDTRNAPIGLLRGKRCRSEDGDVALAFSIVESIASDSPVRSFIYD